MADEKPDEKPDNPISPERMHRFVSTNADNVAWHPDVLKAVEERGPRTLAELEAEIAELNKPKGDETPPA